MTRGPVWEALFDEAYYVSRNPDSATAPGGPAGHFRKWGWSAGFDPHPLFSVSWYNRQIGLRPHGETDPLRHYIAEGAVRGLAPHPLFIPPGEFAWVDEAERAPTPLHAFLSEDPETCRSPHWLFDINLYRALYRDQIQGQTNPLVHYITAGEALGNRPSAYFDPTFYSAGCLGEAPPLGTALTHYAEESIQSRRSPCLLFDAAWYRRGLALQGLHSSDPFRHFMEEGDRMGLSPHPLFDGAFYLRHNDDVAASGMGALFHFLLYGLREDRAPHPLFSSSYYLNNNSEVRASGVDALSHYLLVGGPELRNPHPMFDAEYYVRLYPEVREAGVNPLVDYLVHDAGARRDPHPLFDRVHQTMATAGSASLIDDPLSTYVEFRANLDEALIGRAATSVPRAERVRPSARTAAPLPPPISDGPLVSILIPLYESDERLLKVCFDSIRAQSYLQWEVLAVDDGSVSERPLAITQEYALRDPRFSAHRLESNQGISAATNAALGWARGEFVAMVDHDDIVAADALQRLVAAVLDADADAAYTDQSYIAADGRFEGAFHKPAWSPALMTGVMYVGHLLMVRRSVALAAGGFDPGFDRLQDFEFMLRVGERTKRIVHVPRLLYGWRRVPGSIAFDSAAKGAIEPQQARAVQAHLARIGRPAEVTPIARLHHRMRVRPDEQARLEAVDLVRLVAPSDVEVLRRTPGAGLPSGWIGGVSVVDRTDLPAVGEALAAGESPFVVAWDDRVTPLGRWLDHLLMYLTQEDVAFCAPHLFTAFGVVVAAGFAADAEEGLMPAMAGFRFGEDGYAGSLACDREVSALPGGLLGIKRDVVAELGGLHRDYGGLYYALGDLTFRASAAGRRNVAIADNLTEVSVAFDLHGEALLTDKLIFLDRHRTRLALGDPYYNRNFRPASASFDI